MGATVYEWARVPPNWSHGGHVVGPKRAFEAVSAATNARVRALGFR